MKFPSKPFSSMPFPRGLSKIEQEILMRIFDERMMDLGLSPCNYYGDLREYVLEWRFDDWTSVKECFNKVINAIKSGEIYYIRSGKIEPPCKVPIPYKTVDEAVKQFFAAFYYNKFTSGINKIVEGVKKLGFKVEPNVALRMIVRSWKEKDSRYAQLTKEQVAATLEVPVEEIEKIDC